MKFRIVYEGSNPTLGELLNAQAKHEAYMNALIANAIEHAYGEAGQPFGPGMDAAWAWLQSLSDVGTERRVPAATRRMPLTRVPPHTEVPERAPVTVDYSSQ